MKSVPPRSSGWVLVQSLRIFGERPTRYREVVLTSLHKEPSQWRLDQSFIKLIGHKAWIPMSKTLTHAGAVAFRESEPEILYLVVSSSDGLNWVLPKGHIEIGESPDVAALRELEEEAGTIGEIVEPLSVRQFKKGDRDAAAQYFLVRELGSTESIERRTMRWEPENAALQLLTFAEAKAALLEGAAMVRGNQMRGLVP